MQLPNMIERLICFVQQITYICHVFNGGASSGPVDTLTAFIHKQIMFFFTKSMQLTFIWFRHVRKILAAVGIIFFSAQSQRKNLAAIRSQNGLRKAQSHILGLKHSFLLALKTLSKGKALSIRQLVLEKKLVLKNNLFDKEKSRVRLYCISDSLLYKLKDIEQCFKMFKLKK